VDYVEFIRRFVDRIYHVHMKDVWWGHGDGTVGVFGGHTNFADPRRYWDFRSLGHGGINFEEIIVALNDIGYAGPLSVEWEDSRMDREHGAKEACAFVKKLDFKPSARAFDAAFEKSDR
jgi:sugar phosphate isomerase/epimerase